MLAKGPVWGQKSTKWTPRLRGRKRRWMRCTARMGRLRILPSLRRQSSRKSYNISENHTNSKKIPEQYHLPPDGYKFHRISPDFTGPPQVTPNTTK